MCSLLDKLKYLRWGPGYGAWHTSGILYSAIWQKTSFTAEFVSFLMKLQCLNLNLKCETKAWYTLYKRSVFLCPNATVKSLDLFSLSKLFMSNKRCVSCSRFSFTELQSEFSEGFIIWFFMCQSSYFNIYVISIPLSIFII